jgi:hypothetical protein
MLRCRWKTKPSGQTDDSGLRYGPRLPKLPARSFNTVSIAQVFHPAGLDHVLVHPGHEEDFFSPSIAKTVKANMGMLLLF